MFGWLNDIRCGSVISVSFIENAIKWVLCDNAAADGHHCAGQLVSVGRRRSVPGTAHFSHISGGRSAAGFDWLVIAPLEYN